MVLTIGGAVLVAVLLGAIDILREDYSPPVAGAIIGSIVVFSAVLMLRFTRLATTVDATGVAIKGFFTTRRVPWSRIQAIIIETNSSHYTESKHPKQIAVAYLDNGRRLHLRGVDDKNLEAMNLQLPTVVDFLRQQWIAGRGDGWRPVADVQAAAAQMARFGVSAAIVGVVWFLAGVAVMTVLTTTLILLKGELDLPVFVDGGSGFLALVFGLMLGVPVIAGVVAGLHAAAQRRRARRMLSA